MAKKQNANPNRTSPRQPKSGAKLGLILAGLVLGSVAVVLLAQKPWSRTKPSSETASKSSVVVSENPRPAPLSASPGAAGSPISVASNATGAGELPTMNINQAVMVTVELDFGPQVPTIAQALREIERRSTPDDGRGRTFAILDAYGEPTAAGKLHMSMHVSSEKTGVGALVFRRSGEVLWQSRIINTNSQAQIFSGKNLLLLIDNGEGRTFTIDGSANPPSILDATIKEMGIPVRIFWPEGAERELTFIYSACGCPVKAMVKREGERTFRTKELPVMFPDDPAAMTVISKLMQWQ